jgi:hypothetical protein
MHPYAAAGVFLFLWVGIFVAYEHLALDQFGREGTITGLVQMCAARFPLLPLIIAVALAGLWLHMFKQGVTIP